MSVRLAVAVGAFVTLGVSSRAGAVPTTPPDGYYYTARKTMTASNIINFDDFKLIDDGYYQATVSSNAAGTAVTVFSYYENNPNYAPLDYYFEFPYTTSSGDPDTTYVTFDLRDWNGEFAGFSESFTWNSNGQNWYYLYQEINGEGHYLYFSADANGNVDPSTLQQVKHVTKRPDRCKILSDWGAYQCPRDLHGIREIPTQVRSFMKQVGWFSDAVNWTANELNSAANDVVNFLKDPTVQYVLVGIGILVSVDVCCALSSGTACAACFFGGLASLGAAAGSYYNNLNSGVPIITNSPGLRGAGILLCSGSGCQSDCVPIQDPDGHTTLCSYTTYTGTCRSPYAFVGPSSCRYTY